MFHSILYSVGISSVSFSAFFRVATVHVKNGSAGSFESQLSLNFYSVSTVYVLIAQ